MMWIRLGEADFVEEYSLAIKQGYSALYKAVNEKANKPKHRRSKRSAHEMEN